MISEQTIDTIKRTAIRGFHLNSECEDRLGSIYFDSDEIEDDFIKVIPMKNGSGVVVEYVECCESTKMDYYEIDEISLDGLLKFGVYLNEEFGKQE